MVIFMSSGGRSIRKEAELRCIELASGKVQWSQPDLTRSSLLLVDGFMICLSETGPLRLLRVNPKKYEEVSRLDFVWEKKGGTQIRLAPLMRPPCWAAPILSHGLLYVRGDNRLLCLELIPAGLTPSKCKESLPEWNCVTCYL